MHGKGVKPTENGIYYTAVEMVKKLPILDPSKKEFVKKSSFKYYTKANELHYGNQSKQGNYPTKPNDEP